MKIRKLLAAALACAGLAGVLTAKEADATPSAPCLVGQGKIGYTQGRNIERMVLDTLWTTTNRSCNTLELYIKGINLPISTRGLEDAFLVCRNLGMADAVGEVITSRSVSCGTMCTINGASIGAVTARQFCGIFESAQCNPPRTALCSIVAGEGCYTTFFATVDELCPAKKTDSAYQAVADAACKNL